MSDNDKIIPCPMCGKSAAWSAMNSWRPFCSKRCKWIDMGKWANEEYAIEGEEVDLPNADELPTEDD